MAKQVPALAFTTVGDIGEIWGRLQAQLHQTGRSLSDNDLWIAASAIAHDAPLVTNNVAHFRQISGLRLAGPTPPSS